MTPARSLSKWALIFAAVFGLVMIALSIWLTWILSSQSWCSQSLGAVKYAIDKLNAVPITDAAGGCFALQTTQLEALRLIALIAVGAIAVGLISFIVVGILGARLEAHGPAGLGLNIGAEDAAQSVATAAQDRADHLKDDHP
ncbi:hypothetical protein [Novosphingobium sp. 9]|uniref:hypothetical protein n=1 Tax=Novosphingobium sp. 9 TaxID=2025349 RepID=UPI0021B6C7DE|nr:hypothetical protein [Novosphingobium sp. 9]